MLFIFSSTPVLTVSIDVAFILSIDKKKKKKEIQP